MECDPTSSAKKPDPNSPESYLYCNLEGSFSRRKCLKGKIFNAKTVKCESIVNNRTNDDPFSQPLFQAPDDLCGSGIPLTILSAPMVCNPGISSCPDGYVCRMYERTGTSYCCQGSSPPIDKDLCGQGHVTYFETTGKPRSCVLSSSSSCPPGFGCTLVGGTITRCCGKDLGCLSNSAAFLHPKTKLHVECSPSDSCQNGFSCIRSKVLQKHICCSSSSDEWGKPDIKVLSISIFVSYLLFEFSSQYLSCCFPGVCPAGVPLGGGPTVCGKDNPCQDGYQCVTTGSFQYCCPSRENVCSLSRNGGVACASTRSSVSRYYFDVTTGSCRSFQFSQCGGNANNFNSLEECEGFCLDTQCQHGQAYRVGALNAICSLTATNACPNSHSCMTPVFGPSAICCPVPELTCNEMVSAGTPCYGSSMTVQRFYFNTKTRKCQAFQYYGCNGNGNNFPSLKSCHDHCVHEVETVCDGPAVLMDPNQQPQRCSGAVPCPSGYACNPEHYCCPFSETACSASLSKGDVCEGVPLRTMWYYDQKQAKCIEFSYNGCGGTANRFTSRKACTSTCVNSSLSGSCPRGMSPVIEYGDTTVKECTLNVMGTCPFSASCVRSTTNQPICCQAVTSCPNNRIPYVIPGSTSVVACNIETDECPAGNTCVESRFTLAFNQILFAYYIMFSISPCPAQLTTNGQTCTVNAIGDCPRNYLCFRDVGFKHGSCCRTGPPRCAIKQYVPVFLSGTQVQICQADLGGCPQNSRCITSNIPKVSICCQLYGSSSEFRSGSSNKLRNEFQVMARPHAQTKCRNGDRPLARAGVVFGCSFIQDDCPAGYKCEFSSTGQAVCCGDSESIRCPVGSSAFEYGGRPLACPAGSTKCPNGFACIPSMNPQYHLCCSMASFMMQAPPQCLRGTAFIDLALNRRQFCSPLRDSCPIGYHCMESNQAGQYICCSQSDLSEQFKGFCPPNQIPYVSREGFPPTCHMQLNPCPTTAPYICIYSAMKQDSYCCAPIDSSFPNIPNISMAASPMKGITPEITSVSASHPYAGMSQTFPGGQLLPPIGPIGIPDRIPGVNLEKILPPALTRVLGQMPTGIFAGNSNTNNMLSNAYGAVPGGCPIGSMALVRVDHTVVTCAEQSCPIGFMCLFAEKENRFQCCSLSSTNTALTKSDSSTQITPSEISTVCPQGFFLIDGKCLKVLFAGQKGCLSDKQCVAREPNATCDNGYCVCPVTKPLVHDGKCVSGCPEGFANIAGRCYDPTTVIFMDSVDGRENGTIGGYCLETLVEEKRCVVENSYCSEKTVTCQCKVGYSLDMDFDNKEDKPFFSDMNLSGVEPTTNSTLDDDEEIDKYLFQSDEFVTSFT
ncbi:unnamed protein product [Angiostrongylus costaricensis]|uniref:Kunitz/Bovine pancreatic trypsin inhibitor domain protein n=1 Tax=Angiostrongylus costaricensis TaxID=334426 RepID=A0A0R3PC30_ANGCS|nr:unnamed protein product [Angiostrongylus costaricensis]